MVDLMICIVTLRYKVAKPSPQKWSSLCLLVIGILRGRMVKKQTLSSKWDLTVQVQLN